YQIDGAQGASDNLVVNNTIYTYLAPTTPNTGSLRAALQVANNCNNNTIFNNIIYAIGPGYTAAFEVGVVTGLQHDYNIVGRFGGNAPHFSGTTASSHEISPTPGIIFNDVSNANFTLIPGCPAENAGISIFNSLPAPLKDILGNVRPQGSGFDLGCYETLYGSPTITSTMVSTLTSTRTFSRTSTPVATNTNTPAVTFSFTTTRTVPPVNTFTFTQTFTRTITMSATLTNTITLTVTGTPPTQMQTTTLTYTFTISITYTNTPFYSPTISSEEKLKIYDCILFPNPWTNELDMMVRFATNKQPEKITIEIYTMALRKVYEQIENNLITGEIIIRKENLKICASGIYLYRLKLKYKNEEIYTNITPFIILNK
ncbi:MAG: hypothetical protein N2114_02725, partial [Candidatus Goldbacteria bacterium]|nr:hypothetical protein [Candidatus Goldiibacteriota bacterium]